MSQPLGASYDIDERIGQGATGEVWRGRRRSDGHPFAFKLLRPHLLSDQAVVTRFLQERSVLMGVEEHPNLVQLHDLVVEGQHLAVVMDLVDGGDLRKELRQRRTLRAGEALTLIAGVLTGVGWLHAASVVHRDLKPENVLLDMSGVTVVPRLTDYGTARLVAESAATHTTSVIGTPEYMAPELADRGEVSGAADVYSAGVILYELVCGVTPFAGGLPVAVLRRHIEQQPGRPDHVDDRLWDLLSRMLAKQPAERPLPHVAALESLALAQTLADAPALPPLTTPPLLSTPTVIVARTPGAPQPPSRASSKKARLPLLIGAAATAAVLLIGGGIALANRGNQTAVPAAPPAPASPADTSRPATAPVPTGTTPASSDPSATATRSPVAKRPKPTTLADSRRPPDPTTLPESTALPSATRGPADQPSPSRARPSATKPRSKSSQDVKVDPPPTRATPKRTKTAAAEPFILRAGETLGPGQRLVSADGRYVLIMQADGNLVEYAPGNHAIWATGTSIPNSVVVMQGDGNVVIRAPGNRPVWATRTDGNPGSTLELQDDGNVVVYAPGHLARWDSR